jgi:hypothetical protein
MVMLKPVIFRFAIWSVSPRPNFDAIWPFCFQVDEYKYDMQRLASEEKRMKQEWFQTMRNRRNGVGVSNEEYGDDMGMDMGEMSMGGGEMDKYEGNPQSAGEMPGESNFGASLGQDQAQGAGEV